MARPSNGETRRREIVLALERVLARTGLAGATIAAVADEAELAPGLVHHHFADKEELFSELTRSLYERFRAVSRDQSFHGVLDAALAIRGARGVRAARAWVGLFAESLRSPQVHKQLRRVLSAELRRLDRALIEQGSSPRERSRSRQGCSRSFLERWCLARSCREPARALPLALRERSSTPSLAQWALRLRHHLTAAG